LLPVQWGQVFLGSWRASQRALGFIDMPLDIRDKYQYFTEANMNKLLAAGYDQPFSSLEEGVADYVQNYLVPGKGY